MTSISFSLQNNIALSDSEPGCIQTLFIPYLLQSLTTFSVIFGGIIVINKSGALFKKSIKDLISEKHLSPKISEYFGLC